MKRVRIPQDKADLLQNLLLNNDNPEGLFDTYADILAFCASLGKKYNRKIALTTIAKEPYPINIDVFYSRGYQPLMELIAILECETLDDWQQSNLQKEEITVTAFEQYAYGGLTILEEKLQGSIDYTERVLLILSQEQQVKTKPSEEFDLSRFLP